MNEYMMYAIKGDTEYRESIWESLVNSGEGRYGWSYVDSANLNDLKISIEKDGWSALRKDDQDCFQGWLLDLKEGDYVVYINVPTWGECTIARVTGPYFWRYEDDDLNHRFPVDRDSVMKFNRNDPHVHPALSARLKLQGRYWRIYLKDEFEQLLTILRHGGAIPAHTPKGNLEFLKDAITPHLLEITKQIHHTHPNTSLESLFAEVLRRVPGVKQVIWQGGAGDHGADIRIVFETGLPFAGLTEQRMCVVQVKSFEGEHWDTKAVEDIRRAMEYYPEANTGLIVSTALSTSQQLEDALQRLREETKKPIGLLIGADVAAFFLRYTEALPQVGSSSVD